MDSLERVASAVEAFLEDRTEELGLHRTQGKILLYLFHHPDGNAQISNMAKDMKRSKPTISDAVDRLVKKTFIERTVSEQDRRMIDLELTEKGQEAASDLAGWPETLETYMDSFSREEKQTVLQFLMQIIEGSLEEGIIPTARMCTTCRFFNDDPEGYDSPFYCDLLEIPLDSETLRLHCDEQKPGEEYIYE